RRGNPRATTRLLRRRLAMTSVSITLVLTVALTSCASIKTVNVWKDEARAQRLQKVFVMVVAELDFMQKHFENVLSERLVSRGIEATPANKVFSESSTKLGREAIAAKVRELGITSVLVARVVSREEAEQLIPGGVYVVPTNYYDSGYYGFYSGGSVFVPISGTAYDSETFTLVTNIYEVSSEKLVWSCLSSVKVEGSREAAINPFIDNLMKRMDESKLL
ncbi:MAG TPA: hypothetical protein VMH06_03940, partial [Thermodesulfovibrionales bacterium]|nr:hypothetical protein [Thermodesulfovibrionales bacterium]